MYDLRVQTLCVSVNLSKVIVSMSQGLIMHTKPGDAGKLLRAVLEYIRCSDTVPFLIVFLLKRMKRSDSKEACVKELQSPVSYLTLCAGIGSAIFFQSKLSAMLLLLKDYSLK